MMYGTAADYERAPCATCGATTAAEAETMCRPHQTQEGEYFCEVGDDEIDAEGFILRPTAAALARLDAWVDAEVAKLEGKAP